jgi:hypothetical protein
MAFQLAYATSAVEFADRKWLPLSEYSTEETRKLAPGITEARILARQRRGELTSVEIPPGLFFAYVATPIPLFVSLEMRAIDTL